ncbi:MAG: surface lipoprotein assembly modifier [Pseudomonadota bacterium]
MIFGRRFFETLVAGALCLIFACHSVGVAQTPDGTLDSLRASLAIRPDDDRLRAQLGQRLIEAKRYTEALYHFEILVDEVEDPGRRRLYQAVIARILAERPVGFGVILQVKPSTNLNTGSDQTRLTTSFGTLVIDEPSQAQRGIEYSYGLNGFLRAPLDTGDRVRLSWSAYRTDYSTDLVEARRTGQVALSWQRVRPRGSVAISIGEQTEFSDSERKNTSIISLNGALPLASTRRLNWQLSQFNNRYRSDPEKSGLDHLLSLQHVWLSGDRRQETVGLLLESSRPARAHQQFRGLGISFGARRSISDVVFVDASLNLGHRDFEGVFPGQSFARKDTYGAISLSVQRRRPIYRGFAPRMTCSVKRTESNITLYDATTTECAVSLARQF